MTRPLNDHQARWLQVCHLSHWKPFYLSAAEAADEKLDLASLVRDQLLDFVYHSGHAAIIVTLAGVQALDAYNTRIANEFKQLKQD